MKRTPFVRPVALTLWPEWVPAILGGPNWPAGIPPKRCENRTWAPSAQLRPGDWFWLHAGRRFGGTSTRWRMEHGIPVRDAAYRAAESAGHPWPAGKGWTPWSEGQCVTPGCIVAAVEYLGWDREHRTGWDAPGMVHWRLGQVRLVPEMRARGAQGLWAVSPEHAAAGHEWLALCDDWLPSQAVMDAPWKGVVA